TITVRQDISGRTLGSKRLHLTLFQKALILVAVPLAFELLLLGIVNWLLIRSEQEALAADRAKAVIAKTNEVIQLLCDVGFCYVAYDAHTNQFQGERLAKAINNTPIEFKALEELLKDDQQHLPIVQKAEEQAMEQINAIALSTKKIQAGG